MGVGANVGCQTHASEYYCTLLHSDGRLAEDSFIWKVQLRRRSCGLDSFIMLLLCLDFWYYQICITHNTFLSRGFHRSRANEEDEMHYSNETFSKPSSLTTMTRMIMTMMTEKSDDSTSIAPAVICPPCNACCQIQMHRIPYSVPTSENPTRGSGAMLCEDPVCSSVTPWCDMTTFEKIDPAIGHIPMTRPNPDRLFSAVLHIYAGRVAVLSCV